MLERISSLTAWTESLLVHVAIAVALMVTIDFTAPPMQGPKVDTIKATIVDLSAMESVKEQRREEERRQRRAEQQRQERIAQEKRAAAEQEAQRKAEAERKKQAEIEAQRKAEAEKKRQAELEAQRKAEAEKKRQAELEAQRKAEAEARAKAEAAARAAREAELSAAMDAESARLTAIESGKLAEYQTLIQQKVMRNWLPPAKLADSYYCELKVRQIPGGEVVSINVVKCDDDFLARSAEAAVWKSSPLPPPPDRSLFDQRITVLFKPENGK